MNDYPSFKLYYLAQFQGITRRKLQHYLNQDYFLERLLYYSSNDLQRIFQLPHSPPEHFYQYLRDSTRIKQSYEEFKRLNPLTIYHQDYPDSLKTIPDPPLILYWKGNIDIIKSKKISVIGSRDPSSFAQKKVNLFVNSLLKNRVTVVSGLAYGIDSMAHSYTLSNGGFTIAVIGFGFNHIYPKEHMNLFQQISNHGLVLSEYHPNTKAKKWHFPERNRIISGLSAATLIIEAAERSGTMITADQALEQGKEVFVVPDSIFLNQAQGCLKLIQEGATPLIHPNELDQWIDENASIFS
ncbi:DNA-processing protein DprA [Piscibacillus halophilus]|uniref:DNA processing protein n=1 Tax=Piscibacillus halophilus TaxID=571933 RepID=A0A1H8YZG8_9BACI|nr:DNA-processing protein DprA [Piscibacillus halophilus]SEP56758.1 DNA processing protein [Piscibacillus halophilus]